MAQRFQCYSVYFISLVANIFDHYNGKLRNVSLIIVLMNYRHGYRLHLIKNAIECVGGYEGGQ